MLINSSAALALEKQQSDLACSSKPFEGAAVFALMNAQQPCWHASGRNGSTSQLPFPFLFRFSSGVFQSAAEAPASVPDVRAHRDSSINYVNIPISPLRARANGELLYTELDLQEASAASVSGPRGNTLRCSVQTQQLYGNAV